MELEQALAAADEAIFAYAERHLNDVETAILRGSWQGQTYEQIADASGYSISYLTRDIGPKLWKLLGQALGETVSKTSFQAALLRWQERQGGQRGSVDGEAAENAQSPPTTPFTQPASHSATRPLNLDWGEAPDVSTFFGRQDELVTLSQWLVQERCRLVLLLGMGGIGKTSLAVKVAQQCLASSWGAEWEGMPAQSHSPATQPPNHPATLFTHVIWRSLRNAPALSDLLRDLLLFLTPGDTSEPTLLNLMQGLRSHRCLIILDNAETILKSGEELDHPPRSGVGRYREGYEDYADFIRVMGETAHQSCLLLTSREKFTTIVPMESDGTKVRSLQLSGSAELGLALMSTTGLRGSLEAQQALCDRYSSNPLALKIVAGTIQDLFDGDIATFLAQGTGVFNGIRRLLNQQFERLSANEQAVMHWLAINREWTKIADLAADLLPPISRGHLLEALESLGWRGLIERRAGSYTQQPVVMEYTTDVLIQQMSDELSTAQLDWFCRYAVLKTTVKDYIRESQERMLAHPIATQFRQTFSSPAAAEQQFLRILLALRRSETQLSGYGVGNLINLARLLSLDLTGFDFSGLTIRHAYLQGMQLHNVNFAEASFLHPRFTGTVGNALSLAFSPDGQFICTGDHQGQVYLWRVADGLQHASFEGHDNWVRSVAFSPDGTTLATCSDDQTIRLWNWQTGEPLRTIAVPDDWVTLIVFSPDGTLVASANDRTLTVWNAASAVQEAVLMMDSARVSSLAFAPQVPIPEISDLCLASSSDEGIILWDIASHRRLSVIPTQHRIEAIAFSPDGAFIAMAGAHATLELWSVATQQCVRQFSGHQGTVQAIAFSPDGQWLVSGGQDTMIKLWQVSSGTCVKTLQKHQGKVLAIALSPDGKLLASSDNNRCYALWDVETGGVIYMLRGYSNHITSLAIHPEGQLLASGDTNKQVHLWDVQSKQVVNTFSGHDGIVWTVDFVPEQRAIASGSSDHTVKFWDYPTGQLQQTWQRHSGYVRKVVFNRRGTRMASSGGNDTTLKLWDVPTGEIMWTQEHGNWVRALALSADETLLASGGGGQAINLWHFDTGHPLGTLTNHQGFIDSLAFSPTAPLLASASDDRTVRLWDVESRQSQSILQKHTQRVRTVAFSSDGTQLASGGNDTVIWLWDVATGQALRSLRGHTAAVWALAFFPSGEHLASGSADGTIRLWEVESGQCVDILRCDRPYEGMNISGIQGLTPAQQEMLKTLGATRRC